MTATETPVESNGQIVDSLPARYGVQDHYIAELRTKYADLKADTSEGYEEVRLAIAEVRNTRVGVEKTRKMLKEDSLAYGRKVDAEAARITKALEAIENPLKAKKQAVDDAREAEARAIVEAAKAAEEARIAAEVAAKEAEAKAKLDAEQAKIDADRAKLEEERKAMAAEQARLDAERAERDRIAKAEADEKARLEKNASDALTTISKLLIAASTAPPAHVALIQSELADMTSTDQRVRDAFTDAKEKIAGMMEQARQRELIAHEQKQEFERLEADRQRMAAEQKAEQDKVAAERAEIEAQRKAVQAAREKAEREEFERQAKIKADAEAKAAAELAAKQAEEAAIKEKERQAAQAARLEALKPDLEKLQIFAGFLRQLDLPAVKSKEAKAVVAQCRTDLNAIAMALEQFKA